MNGSYPSALAAALGVALLLPRTVPAQEVPDSVTLSGWIVDATSRQPLSGAYVVVDGSDVRAVTGEGGGFRLAVPSAAGYTLRVGRFGYLEMRFDVGEEEVEEQLAGELLILPLEVAPIEIEGLEVTVDRLAAVERQLERRAASFDGTARTLEAERIARTGAPSALDVVLASSTGLFECAADPLALCSRPRLSVSLEEGLGPTEAPVPVCLDERPLWGGTAELLAIPAGELYRVEFYGFGSRHGLRLYTRRFMARSAATGRRGFLPVATPGREGMLEC